MVDGQHKLSRRALLGVVCVAPLVRHPELVSGSSPDAAERVTRWTLKQVQGDGGGQGSQGRSSAATLWDRAFAVFEKAQAALDAAAHTDDEDRYDRLGARHERILQRLLRTPAPDLPALAAKLDLALDERSGEFFGDSAAMKAIKSDASRLVSPGNS